MGRLSLIAAAALLVIAPAFAQPVLLSGGQDTSTQNPQDVPKQQPGTNNPDVSKQRHPDSTKPSTGTEQQAQDVPQQKPGGNNPDVSKQRHHSKKKKSTQSTATSSSTRP